MNFLIKFTFIIQSLFLIACDSSGTNNGSKPTQNVQTAMEKNYYQNKKAWKKVWRNKVYRCPQRLNQEGPFACVASACNIAGGTFDNNLQSCECPSGLAFSAKYASCLPPVPSSVKEELSQWKKTANMIVMSDQNSIMALDKIFDGMNSKTTAKLNFPMLFDYNFLLYFQSPKTISEKALFSALTIDQGFLGGGQLSVSHPVELVYDQNQILNYIGKKENVQVRLPELENNIWKEAAEAWKFFEDNKHLAEKSYQLFGKSSCAELCYQDLKLSFGNMFVVERKVFAEGGLLSQKFYVSPTSQIEDSVQVIILDRGGEPNLLFKIQEHYENKLEYGRKAQAYTRDGILLANKTILHGSEESWKESNLEQLQASLPLADSSTLAICEVSLNPEGFSKSFLGRFRFGPYANLSEKSGSFWGWDANQEGSLRKAIGALKYWGQIGYATEDDHTLSHFHMTSVAIAATRASKETSIAPVFLDQCFSKDKETNPILNGDLPSRVINVSMSFKDDNNQCLNVLNTIKQAADKLFVFGAGNNGNTECDRRIAKQKNVITVAALEKYSDQIASYSVKGKHSVTTAVGLLTHDKGIGSSGTSFAAPVVASQMSNIMDKFPITPYQAKLVSIVGADLSYLDVMSGGIFNKEKAEFAAEAMLDSEWNIDSVLSAVYQLDKVAFKLEALEKIGLSNLSYRKKQLYRELSYKHSRILKEIRNHKKWLMEVL